MELQIIRKAKNFRNFAACHLNDEPGALTQTPAKYWVNCILPGLLHRSNRKSFSHLAVPQPPELGKNKPHPVRPFLARCQFQNDLIKDRILGLQKMFKFVLRHDVFYDSSGAERS